jgi:hypothetical protein
VTVGLLGLGFTVAFVGIDHSPHDWGLDAVRKRLTLGGELEGFAEIPQSVLDALAPARHLNVHAAGNAPRWFAGDGGGESHTSESAAAGPLSFVGPGAKLEPLPVGSCGQSWTPVD